MPRRVQDILPSDRRTIREIPAKPARQESRAASQDADDNDDSDAGRPVSVRRMPLTPPASLAQPPRKPPRAKKRRAGPLAYVGGAIALVLIVAAAGWAASVYFARATFTIVPRTVPIAVNSTLVASGTSTPGYISYQLVHATASATTTLSAVNGSYVSTKATGSMVMYNSYSATAQRLVAGTRLTSPDGLIYRLNDSVAVPGYTVKSGAKAPGSIKVNVTADQAGAQYNLAAASAGDFHVAAYAGEDRDAGFIGHLSTDLAGGFQGTKKIIDPAALASTSVMLQQELAPILHAEAAAAVPDDSIMYGNAYVTSFSAPVTGSASSANQAVVSVTGTIYGIAFKRSDLLERLAGAETIASFDGMAFATPGLDDLAFTVSNPQDFAPAKKSILIARIAGPLSLVGTVPTATLKAKLAGLPLNKTAAVLQAYSPIIDIENSSGELTPSWVSTVPSDVSRITIKVPAAAK